MDPVSLIVGAVGNVVDIIGGGPQARAAQAASAVELERIRLEEQKAQSAQTTKLVLYGVGGLVAVVGLFIVYKAVA
jgi:hypothetical protein